MPVDASGNLPSEGKNPAEFGRQKIKDRIQNTEYRIQNTEYRIQKDPTLRTPERRTPTRASKPPPIMFAGIGWAIASHSPGAEGRPLRRRRETGVDIAAPRLRGKPEETRICEPRTSNPGSPATRRKPAPEEPQKLRFGRVGTRPRPPGTGRESQLPIWMSEYCSYPPRCRPEPAR